MNLDIDQERFKSDPVAFAREVLGVGPFARQSQILDSLVRADEVAVLADPFVGATFTAAVAALWWWAAKGGLCVVLVENTRLKTIVDREIKRLIKYSKKKIRSKDGIYILCDTRMNAVAGLQETGPVLLVEDRAELIKESKREEVLGITAAKGSKIFRLGQWDGALKWYAGERTMKTRNQHVIRYADTPNYQQGKLVIPGLPGPGWVPQTPVSAHPNNEHKYSR